MHHETYQISFLFKTAVATYPDGQRRDNQRHSPVNNRICNRRTEDHDQCLHVDLYASMTPAKAVIDRMIQAVHTFVGDAEQSDDLTLLSLSYK